MTGSASFVKGWLKRSAVRRGERVAVVAGRGDFAVRVAEELKRIGARVLVVSVERDDDRVFEPVAEDVVPVLVSEGAKALEAVKSRGIRKVTFVGKIVKKKIYDPGFRPDDVSGKVIGRAGREKGDHRILKALSAYLRLQGIRVFGVHELVPEWTAPGRTLGKRAPDPQTLADIRVGLAKARAIGRLDIGQAVAVKNGTVIAVEGLEGTDGMIDRVGALGVQGAVLVKTAKPQQDLRFDMPVIGEETLERAAKAGFAAVCAEKGRTLLADPSRMVRTADRLGLIFIGA